MEMITGRIENLIEYVLCSYVIVVGAWSGWQPNLTMSSATTHIVITGACPRELTKVSLIHSPAPIQHQNSELATAVTVLRTTMFF